MLADAAEKEYSAKQREVQISNNSRAWHVYHSHALNQI